MKYLENIGGNMNFKYCNDENYEDFACGKVIYHKPGMTNYPVRLAQEIYKRALNYREEKNNICVYDPCCRSGYILTILGLLNGDSIGKIIGSDIRSEAVELSEKNLALLTYEGLKSRRTQLEELFKEYGKTSHEEAIQSTYVFEKLLATQKIKPQISVFEGDILKDNTLVTTDLNDQRNFKADIVIVDVPYGEIVGWSETLESPINKMLDELIPVLNSDSIIAVSSDKKQKITNSKYKRLEKNIIGKRKFEILKLNEF